MSAEVWAALDDDRRIAVRAALIRLLGARDAIVLQQLRWHCDHDGFAAITAEQLADETGLTRDQCRKAITKLMADKLIDGDEQEKFSRRRIYRLMRNGIVECADERTLESADERTLLLSDVEEVLVTAPDAFEAFWGDYPRKIDKAKARSLFEAALKLRPRPDIAAGLERWLAYWRATGDVTPTGGFSSYVPHPATWLHGQRWAVDPPAPARQTGAKPRQRGAVMTNRSGESGVIEL
jgi:predicted NAD-dependent protein-ADP-ribosyltransferase YbiA (DUF1768 family)